MLKQLIQLFAEKFLQGKKSWVSNQSQALISGGTDISYTSNTDNQSFTAPIDGVMCLNTTDAEWVRLSSESNPTRGILLHTPNIDGTFKQLTLPVAKGETISVNVSTDKTAISLKFIPTVGS